MELTNTDKITIPESGYKFEYAKLKGNTYQQSYSGKNLYQSIGITTASNGLISTLQQDGTLKITGTANADYSNFTGIMTTSLPAGTYTLSMTKTMPFRILLRASNNQNIGVIEPGNTSVTFTTTTTLTSLWIWGYLLTSGTTYNETVGFMLEAGSSGTSFEPYTAGPSPNPDYPQDIKVATGEQTITVAGEETTNTYTVNLGNLELCKISNYQDYIYKSGNDWYVHKEVSKVLLNGGETWRQTWTGDGAKYVYAREDLVLPDSKRQAGYSPNTICQSDQYIATDYNGGSGKSIWQKRADNSFPYLISMIDNTNIGGVGRVFIKNLDIATASELVTSLESNPVSLYYILNTPTDTKITDVTLIGQLEALAEENFTRDDEPTITVSSPNEGLIIDKKDLENEVYAIRHGEDLLWANANYVEPTPSDLPEGYTGYDFIKGDGTAWIDTGIVGKNTIKAETSFNVDDYSSDNFYLLSARAGISPTTNVIAMWVNNSSWFTSGWGNTQSLCSSLTDKSYYWVASDGGYTGPRVWTFENGVLSVDGTVENDKSSATWDTSGSFGNIYMFCRTTSSGVDRIANSRCRLRYMKLWDGDTLVRDFVPCTNDSNVAGLFDKVTQTFYGPANGGAFTAGND